MITNQGKLQCRFLDIKFSETVWLENNNKRKSDVNDR